MWKGETSVCACKNKGLEMKANWDIKNKWKISRKTTLEYLENYFIVAALQNNIINTSTITRKFKLEGVD